MNRAIISNETINVTSSSEIYKTIIKPFFFLLKCKGVRADVFMF